MALKCLFFLLTITSLAVRISSSREFPIPLGLIPGFNPTGPNQGPEAEDKPLDCFSALYKIRSCSNEIVAYFSNGSIDIGQPCCQAITLITHHCWPAVLGTLGYGPSQINILRGYCDAVAPDGGVIGPTSSPFGPVLSPVGQPLPAMN